MNFVSLHMSVGRLRTTCPSQDSSRYNQKKRCRPTSLAINPGTIASPTYLPPSWSKHIQPSGKVYFCHAGSIVTVTESWIHTAEIASEATKWIQHITYEIGKTGRDFTNLELYIRIDDFMARDCFYYVVDRQAQTLFWIEDLSTKNVGLPPVVSPSHLKIALETEFWQHTDRFPAHFGGLPEESLLKLLDAFVYIRIDQIRSTDTAFTIPAAETQVIYDVLERCRGRTHQSEVVGTIAYGWSVVLFNRFRNLYGQETPRIDPVYVEQKRDTEKNGYGRLMMRYLTFKQSDVFREELNILFDDQWICSYRVLDFVQGRVKEWKEQVVPSLLMLLLHTPFFFFFSFKTFAATSAMFFGASLMIAFGLIQQHNILSYHKDPALIVAWFGGYAFKKSRIQIIAFAIALPRAFFTWGLLVFFTHCFAIGFATVHILFAAALVGTYGIMCYVFASWPLVEDTQTRRILDPRGGKLTFMFGC